MRQSAFLRARNVSRKVTGLYYAGHSTIPGIGLPMCLISAEILIKAVHGDVSTEPLAEPLRRNTSAASEPPLTAVP
jgi:phytoene dehydrogenase-like protein